MPKYTSELDHAWATIQPVIRGRSPRRARSLRGRERGRWRSLVTVPNIVTFACLSGLVTMTIVTLALYLKVV